MRGLGVSWTANPRLSRRCNEAAGGGGFGAAVEVIGAEVLVEGAVLEHVIGGAQDGGGDRADGLFGASTGAEAVELGLEVAALGSVAAQAHWIRVVFSQGAPLRMRVDRRLPALSSFFGHSPAQEIRWPSVGKRLMSMPISATMTLGAEVAEARNGVLSDRGGLRKGSILASTSWSIPAMAASRASICSRCRREQEAMMPGHAAAQRLAQSRAMRSDPPMRQRRQPSGSVSPAIMASIIARPLTPGDVGDDRVELDVGVLQRLLQTLNMAGCARAPVACGCAAGRASPASASGTKLPRIRPCASSSASQVASFTSVLRPGTFFTCAALASASSNSPSARMCQTGFQ